MSVEDAKWLVPGASPGDRFLAASHEYPKHSAQDVSHRLSSGKQSSGAPETEASDEDSDAAVQDKLLVQAPPATRSSQDVRGSPASAHQALRVAVISKSPLLAASLACQVRACGGILPYQPHLAPAAVQKLLVESAKYGPASAETAARSRLLPKVSLKRRRVQSGTKPAGKTPRALHAAGPSRIGQDGGWDQSPLGPDRSSLASGNQLLPALTPSHNSRAWPGSSANLGSRSSLVPRAIEHADDAAAGAAAGLPLMAGAMQVRSSSAASQNKHGVRASPSQRHRAARESSGQSAGRPDVLSARESKASREGRVAAEKLAA